MELMKEFHFISNEIFFGNGNIRKLGELLGKLHADKVLLVTDKGVAACGIAEKVTAQLESAGIGYELFTDVSPSPLKSEAREAFRILQEKGCKAVIGLGGGSPMDVGKTAAMLATNGGDLNDYIGVDLVKVRPLPVIAIPTTAGTGSESSHGAILKDDETHTKGGIISTKLIPDYALIDPELTYTLPPRVTASTGMDALTHAIEGYTALPTTPMAKMYHREAIRLISKYLRRAVACGEHDREARYYMSLAALLAGIGNANSGCAAVHALAYPLEGTYRVSHGDANAAILPAVMEFNAVADLEGYAEIAQLLGEKTEGLSLRDAALKSAEAVRKLSQDIRIPSLQQIGIQESDIDDLADGAIRTARLMSQNPRKVTLEDAKALYYASL